MDLGLPQPVTQRLVESEGVAERVGSRSVIRGQVLGKIHKEAERVRLAKTIINAPVQMERLLIHADDLPVVTRLLQGETEVPERISLATWIVQTTVEFKRLTVASYSLRRKAGETLQQNLAR